MTRYKEKGTMAGGGRGAGWVPRLLAACLAVLLLPQLSRGQGVAEYSVKPVRVTSMELNEGAGCSYAVVYTCKSDTATVGYLLVPKEDGSSVEIFGRCVSEDHWKRTVGMSPKRYEAGLADVQLAEEVLAEVMRDGVLAMLGQRWVRYIGNPDNYAKYRRNYGFYYNEAGERYVHVQMSLGASNIGVVGFYTWWDACDQEVYVNLNLEKREVVKAYSSTCQSY